jgi:hypothetical protein
MHVMYETLPNLNVKSLISEYKFICASELFWINSKEISIKMKNSPKHLNQYTKMKRYYKKSFHTQYAIHFLSMTQKLTPQATL